MSSGSLPCGSPANECARIHPRSPSRASGQGPCSGRTPASCAALKPISQSTRPVHHGRAGVVRRGSAAFLCASVPRKPSSVTPSTFLSLFAYPPSMPRPSLPLTPAASTEIPGKPDTGAAHDPSWVLPPAAMSDRSRSSVSSSSVASCNASDSSYHPASPVPVKHSIASTAHSSSSNSRKRSANGAAATQDDYGLPPPPTRLRKIIQMKPKEEKSVTQEQESQATEAAATAGSTAKGKSSGGRGKKQNNGTTAAGRKIARKTAHSLIERRRRSKMNEEFGVLKDMIPACTGQEMHKLAILQVSRRRHRISRRNNSWP